MVDTTSEQRAATVTFLVNAANYFMAAAQLPGAPSNVVVFANRLMNASVYMSQDGATIVGLQAQAMNLPANVKTLVDALAGIPTS
jgi:hypothetical protein